MNKLNAEQLAAATAPAGYNLIIASAGTGKTSTIVARISHLLNCGAKPEQIVLLTFTNKAAREMIERLSAKLGAAAIKGMVAGTFHSVALDFLRKSGRRVHLKRAGELRMLLKSCYEKYRPNPDEHYDASYLAQIYSLFNNTAPNEDFAAWLRARNEAQAEHAALYARALDDYERTKQAHDFYDFDDLLLAAREFFAHEYAGERFCEVLVDEYQDTNNLQSAILDAMGKNSLFCVGDYDQSIYAFNGANIEIIGSFNSRYEGARIFSLNKNYRSSARILEFANRVIEKNERLYPKQLEVTRTSEAAPVALLEFSQASEQYEFIAEQIKERLAAHEMAEIAVIYRNNSSGDGIERALKAVGVKTARKGGASFYELKEISALLALANLATFGRDVLSLVAVLTYSKGVGAAKVQRVFSALLELGAGNIIRGLCEPLRKENYDFLAASSGGLFAQLSGAERASERAQGLIKSEFKNNPILGMSELDDEAMRFLEQLYLFVSRARKSKSAYELLALAKSSEIFRAISANLARSRSFIGTRVNEALYEQKLEAISKNCDYVLADAKRFSSYEQMCETVLLSPEITSTRGVQLLTVHASKGLEFSCVYVIDLAQGRFPNLKLSASAGGVDEERRLFYVALTRAKDELVLSFAHKMNDGDKTSAKRSQFIDEGLKSAAAE